MRVENLWLSQANTEPTLLRHLVGFGRQLRAGGVAVDPASMIDLCRALDCIDIGARADVKAAARATLVSNRDDLENFERIFAEYWDGQPELELASGKARESRQLDGSRPQQRTALAPLLQQEMLLVNDEERAESAQPVDGDAIAYSKQDVLRHKDLGKLDQSEIAGARTLIANFVKILANRPGHR